MQRITGVGEADGFLFPASPPPSPQILHPISHAISLFTASPLPYTIATPDLHRHRRLHHTTSITTSFTRHHIRISSVATSVSSAHVRQED